MMDTSLSTVHLVDADDRRKVYDWTAAESVTEAVVDAMRSSSYLDDDDVVLYECLETDALETLFQSLQDEPSHCQGTLSFSFESVFVTVSSDGTLTVRERDVSLD